MALEPQLIDVAFCCNPLELDTIADTHSQPPAAELLGQFVKITKALTCHEES